MGVIVNLCRAVVVSCHGWGLQETGLFLLLSILGVFEPIPQLGEDSAEASMETDDGVKSTRGGADPGGQV